MLRLEDALGRSIFTAWIRSGAVTMKITGLLQKTQNRQQHQHHIHQRHHVHVRHRRAVAAPVEIAVNVIYSSSVFARGDENNRDANGRVPGYAVVNLDGRYRVAKGVEVFARVVNLFDKRYSNFGILGENFFTGPGRTFDGSNAINEQFRGPGVPRGVWVGLRYQWI